MGARKYPLWESSVDANRAIDGNSKLQTAKVNLMDDLPHLPLGAHLTSPRWGYVHHGLYAGAGRVIHYAGFDRLFRSGRVEETSLECFRLGCAVQVKAWVAPKFSGEAAIGRARARLGENQYSFWANNCEHFAQWCISGTNRSEQVDSWTAWLRVALDRLCSLLAARGSATPSAGSSHCATLVAAAIAVLALGACTKSGAPSMSPADQAKQAAEELAAKIDRASADSAIVFAVNLGLARDGRLDLASIDVEAYRGRVALRGTAPDAESVARARQIVLGVKGVTGIDNHLTVHPKS